MAPIYDWDGTANNEIGKLYDWDGTTNNQIGKVWDNDGTTNNLIYTACTPITIVPNASGFPASKWTRFIYDSTGAITPSESTTYTTVTVNSSNVELGFGTKGYVNTGYYLPVVVDGLTKLTVNVTFDKYYDNADGEAKVYYRFGLYNNFSGSSGGTMLKGSSKLAEEHTVNTTYDISGYTGTKYIVFMQSGNATDDRVRSTATITALSITE